MMVNKEVLLRFVIKIQRLLNDVGNHQFRKTVGFAYPPKHGDCHMTVLNPPRIRFELLTRLRVSSCSDN